LLLAPLAPKQKTFPLLVLVMLIQLQEMLLNRILVNLPTLEQKMLL
jgi:hypothetical protein